MSYWLTVNSFLFLVALSNFNFNIRFPPFASGNEFNYSNRIEVVSDLKFHARKGLFHCPRLQKLLFSSCNGTVLSFLDKALSAPVL